MEKIITVCLDNGLRIVLMPMKHVKSATIAVTIKVGSRCETKSTNGISHFQEHILLRGGKKYPDQESLGEAADRLGAEQNAETDEETTVYYLELLGSQIEEGLDILSDMVLHAKLNKDDIEQERKVIIEEINRFLDTPEDLAEDNWQSLIFGDQPLGRNILGTIENIKKFKREDFLKHRRRFYTPKNTVISIAGNYPTNIINLVEKYFIFSRNINPKRIWPSFNRKVARQGAIGVLEQDINQAQIMLGVLAPSLTEGATATRFLSKILGSGFGSRLSVKVRTKKGLAYSVGNFYEGFYDAGTFCAYAGTSVSKVEEVIKIIVNEYKDVYKNGVTQDELSKVKGMSISTKIRGYESTFHRAIFAGYQEIMFDEVDTLQDSLNSIKKVTLENINKVAREILVPENYTLYVVGPFSDVSRFEDILKS